MIDNEKMPLYKLKKEIEKDNDIPGLLLTPFIKGVNKEGNKNLYAEQYMYSCSIRFVDEEPTEQEYLNFIANKIYECKLSELTMDQINLAKNTIYFIEKNRKIYKETLLNYLSYIENEYTEILNVFKKEQSEYEDYVMEIVFEVIVVNEFEDIEIEKSHNLYY